MGTVFDAYTGWRTGVFQNTVTFSVQESYGPSTHGSWARQVRRQEL